MIILVIDVCVVGGKTIPKGIWGSKLARNKIPTATAIFSRSNISMVPSVTPPDETGSQKSKMAAEIM